MSIYLKYIIPRLQKQLVEVKNVVESDATAIQGLQETENVLIQILENKDLLNRVDSLLKSKAAQKTDQEVDKKVAEKEKKSTDPQPPEDVEMLKRLKLKGRTLVYQVSCLERLLDVPPIDTIVRKSLLLMQPIVNTLNDCITEIQKLPMPKKESDVTPMSRHRLTLPPDQEDKFKKSHAMNSIRRSYADLESTDLKVCLLSFSIFPEKSVIRKRPLIYWWIGEGFITATQDKTADEIGAEIFEKLIKRDLIQPDEEESSCEVLVKSVTMHPWIRRMLIFLAKEANLFHFDSSWPMMPSYSLPSCRRACLVTGEANPIPQGDVLGHLDGLLTVFNVDLQYLNLKQEWLEKLKRVEVLQLGRWQKSGTHHIEMEYQRYIGSQTQGFLNGLGSQKYLKYLSLRGISRITELPASILNLVSLEILDLRACHDLERLPSDISPLKKLTHLDVSECYLLERMPKGIPKLTHLQVLKGFLIGTEKKTPCRLGDLAKLKKLRRLSIHMGNEAVVQTDEFKKLETATSLRHLKISWGVLSSNFKEVIDEESKKLSFPANLEKLDLQGFPRGELPEGLKPSKLKKLKKLYIMGGELASLDAKEPNEKWMVQILRLNFLKKLTVNPASLKKGQFPCLQYWTLNK